MFVPRAGWVWGIGISSLVLLGGCGGNARSSGKGALGSGGGLQSTDGGGAAGASESNAGSVSVGGNVSRGGNPATGGAGEAGSTDVEAGASGEGGTAGVGGGVEIGGSGGLGGGGGTGGHATYAIGPAAAAACMSLCSAPQYSKCVGYGDLGPTCDNDCASAFAIQDGACTDLGVQMMTCFTETKVPAQYDECWMRVYVISQSCQKQITAYRDCVAAAAAAPLPLGPCARHSSYSPAAGPPTYAAGRCQEERRCLIGLNYGLRCVDDGDGESDCKCGPREFAWKGPSMNACPSNFEECSAQAFSTFTP